MTFPLGIGWWLRSLAVGALAGGAVGFVVGGLLGRAFMRALALAEEDALGLSTAMGAIVGDLTAGGTFFVFFFGALAGVGLGIGYAAARPLLPSGVVWRTPLFTLGATALLVPVIVDGNLEDFAFLPVTLSLGLIVASVALTALPVPLIVERLAPDRERHPGIVSYAIVGLGLAATSVNAALAISSAYAVEPALWR
jgi:hypothetical protein